MRLSERGEVIGVITILDGGTAQAMGDGTFALSQRDEKGVVHTVMVTEDTWRRRQHSGR